MFVNKNVKYKERFIGALKSLQR